VAGCRVVATAEAGNNPLAATIDGSTHTIYVADGSGAVTVVDGARCNVTVSTRCGRALATIKTGGFDVADAVDPRTHTLYVAAPSGDVFVIDVARCNGSTTDSPPKTWCRSRGNWRRHKSPDEDWECRSS
jgi:DNA-binding beta-propeller fold protein YncE